MSGLNPYRGETRLGSDPARLMHRVNALEADILVLVVGPPSPTGPGPWVEIWRHNFNETEVLQLNPAVSFIPVPSNPFPGGSTHLSRRTPSTTPTISETVYFLVDHQITGWGSRESVATPESQGAQPFTITLNWEVHRFQITAYEEGSTLWTRSVTFQPYFYRERTNTGFNQFHSVEKVWPYSYNGVPLQLSSYPYLGSPVGGIPITAMWSDSRGEWVYRYCFLSNNVSIFTPEPTIPGFEFIFSSGGMDENSAFTGAVASSLLPSGDYTALDNSTFTDTKRIFAGTGGGGAAPGFKHYAQYLERSTVTDPDDEYEPYPLTDWTKFKRDMTSENIGPFPLLTTFDYSELPPLDTDALVCPNTITQIRDAIEDIAEYFENPGTGNPYNFTNASADNLYFVACGDRTQFGAQGGARYTWTRTSGDMVGTPTYDIDIGEIEACVAQLEGSSLV